MSEILYECPYCGKLKPSENGTGSDVACCGEVGHARSIGVTVDPAPELEFPCYSEAKGG